ncbi:MAG: aminoglycoside phosphotransferase family protein [Clostridia bacterium]|nr:aminoglycoside phosphotransferase family protein [Clostridia bacterium]
MSITKNHQSTETLHELAAAAFPEKQVRMITELTEGMFNAAYRFDFMDDSASILKIAAASEDGLLSNEINLMQAEVSAMELLRGHGVPYIPTVQFSDFTRIRCSGTYFFMEVMPGRSLSSCKAALSEETVDIVMHEVGLLQRMTTDFHRPRFGLAGDKRQFDTLYALEEYMLGNVLRDAAGADIAFVFTPDALLARLERDRVCFDEVKVPSLVHLDMWDGNIFVHKGHLSGVIDWARALWGDPFMDDRFRTQSQHPAFLSAYGKNTFTPAEKRRILWYDVFLYVTMLTECHYRQYHPDWVEWFTHLLWEAWEELAKPVAVGGAGQLEKQ